MATKDVSRLRLDLPVILPGVPDEADACVGRLVGDLEGRSGIDQVHVLPASGDEPAKLCLHYRPDVLSLGRIREIAEAAGARVTERYGHLLWQTGGLSHERRARTVSEFLRRATGVLEAVTTVAGPVRIEFDRSLTSEGVLRQLLDDLGVEAGPPGHRAAARDGFLTLRAAAPGLAAPSLAAPVSRRQVSPRPDA